MSDAWSSRILGESRLLGEALAAGGAAREQRHMLESRELLDIARSAFGAGRLVEAREGEVSRVRGPASAYCAATPSMAPSAIALVVTIGFAAL